MKMKQPARATNGTQAVSLSSGVLEEHRVLGFGEVHGDGEWRINIRPKDYIILGNSELVHLHPNLSLS